MTVIFQFMGRKKRGGKIGSMLRGFSSPLMFFKPLAASISPPVTALKLACSHRWSSEWLSRKWIWVGNLECNFIKLSYACEDLWGPGDLHTSKGTAASTLQRSLWPDSWRMWPLQPVGPGNACIMLSDYRWAASKPCYCMSFISKQEWNGSFSFIYKKWKNILEAHALIMARS